MLLTMDGIYGTYTSPVFPCQQRMTLYIDVAWQVYISTILKNY